MPLLALILQYSDSQIKQAQAMMPAFLFACTLIGAICILLVMIPTWFICKKAGFSPWLSLLVFVPMGGLVLLYILAFADWKVMPVPQTAYIPPTPPVYPPQA
jgi:hypothetical protein